MKRGQVGEGDLTGEKLRLYRFTEASRHYSSPDLRLQQVTAGRRRTPGSGLLRNCDHACFIKRNGNCNGRPGARTCIQSEGAAGYGWRAGLREPELVGPLRGQRAQA